MRRGKLYKWWAQSHCRKRILRSLLKYLELVNSENKKCTLMGDMNIMNVDLLNVAHHDKTKSLNDSIFSLGYIPYISKPTRIANTSATLLDHIYSNTYPN